MGDYFNSRFAQLGAYLLIVVMGIVGFHALTVQSSARVHDRVNQNKRLCAVAVVDRNALRDNAIATATLGVTLINTPPLPTEPDAAARRVHAIAVINDYRDSQLKKLPALRCDKRGTVAVIK